MIANRPAFQMFSFRILLRCFITFLVVCVNVNCYSSEVINVSKKFLETCKLVASMNPLPPVPAQAKAEIVLTIMGRNLMVVEDKSGPKIVVTGAGPRYDSSSKQALGSIFKCAVLDIVDLMTPDEESSREMRDVFLAFSGILGLKETLDQFNKKNKIDARRANLIKTGLKIISDQNPWVPKPDLEAKLLLLGFPDIKSNTAMGDLDISKKKDVYNELMQQLEGILNTLSPRVSTKQAHLLNVLRELTLKYHPFEDQKLLTSLEQAFSVLEKFGPEDFVKAMVSRARSIKMDIGDMKLGSDEQQYALAHFLHSEQLAYTWMLHKGNRPKNYMYTQRGMCETCNPFIIRVFRTCPTKFYVLSTYPANRPGRAPGIEIDGNWHEKVPGIIQIDISESAKCYFPVIRAKNRDTVELALVHSNSVDMALDHALSVECDYLSSVLIAPNTTHQNQQDLFLQWVNTQRKTSANFPAFNSGSEEFEKEDSDEEESTKVFEGDLTTEDAIAQEKEPTGDISPKENSEKHEKTEEEQPTEPSPRSE